jgi:hypothetical protein
MGVSVSRLRVNVPEENLPVLANLLLVSLATSGTSELSSKDA